MNVDRWREGGMLLVISGIPGVGKSTVARLVAERFSAGVHLQSDALQRMVVAGSVWPDGEPREEGRRQLRLRGTNTAMLADSFVQAGFVVVVDDVVIGTRVDELLDDVRTRPVRLVMLYARDEVVRERDSLRPDKTVFHRWGRLASVVHDETPRVGLWIDTSDHRVEDTVAEVLTRLDDAVV